MCKAYEFHEAANTFHPDTLTDYRKLARCEPEGRVVAEVEIRDMPHLTHGANRI